MENQKDPLANPQDYLKAENNLLKIKLQLEHGMQMENLSTMSPDVENKWLKSVYAFEQQFKEAKRIKLYDRIARPAFRKWDTLSPAETSCELERLLVLMENHGVELDCICKYDDAVIYKFLTEELFEHEMDDMHVPGMSYHFIYEEFYPNHDYDLRRSAEDFIKAIFTRHWDEEFDSHVLAREVLLAGKDYNRAGISAAIITFQEAHAPLAVGKFDIDRVVIDGDLTKADVIGNISVSGMRRPGDAIRYEGSCTVSFMRDNDYWYIREFCIPGFSGKENC